MLRLASGISSGFLQPDDVKKKTPTFVITSTNPSGQFVSHGYDAANVRVAKGSSFTFTITIGVAPVNNVDIRIDMAFASWDRNGGTGKIRWAAANPHLLCSSATAFTFATDTRATETSDWVVHANISFLPVGTYTITMGPFFVYEEEYTGTQVLSIGGTSTEVVATGANGSVSYVALPYTLDATAKAACPANSTEWTNFISYHSLSIAVPDSLWLCQETGGNFADSIGANALTAGVSTYANTVAGWTRKGFGLNDGTGTTVNTTAGAGGSRTVMIYAKFLATPAAERTFIYNNQGKLNINTTPRFVAGRHLGTMTIGANSPTVGSRVLVHKHNATPAPDVMSFYDSTEKITVAENSGDTSALYVGGVVQTSPASNVMYMCMWLTGNAEISDANVKRLYQAVGLTIAWT